MTLEEVVVKNNVSDNKDLKYIIEYDVDKLKDLSDTNFATIEIKVYKVVTPYGEEFKTNYFTEHSVATESLVKLVNPEGDTTTPTYTVTASSINDIYREIRDKIFLIHDKDLTELNQQYEGGEVHPFYFRPSKSFKTKILDTTEATNRQLIFDFPYFSFSLMRMMVSLPVHLYF